MAEAVTGRGIGVALSKSTRTCNQQAPTRDMQLESHLQDRCDWNCIYKTDAIGITPTTRKCASTRQMQLGMHPLIFECVVPLCQFIFYVNTLCETCLNGILVAGVKVTLINSNGSINHVANGCVISVNMFTQKR
jgi:hypothetical protein